MDWVLFDCDGVLIDSEAVVLAVLERHVGLTVDDSDDNVAHLAGLLGSSLENIAIELAVRHQREFDAAWIATARQRIDQALLGLNAPILDVHWALERIQPRKAVVSNSDLTHLRGALRRTGIADFFGDRVFAAEQVARPKPAPDIYRHAMATLGADPARCVVVEDSRAGVTAAVAAGLRVIGFTGGGHLPANHRLVQRELGAVTSIASMRDLPEVLEQLERDPA